MMINRTNYEEFFLLYADGELSAADKQAVELFVQENADLADELALFQQTQLPEEAIHFTDKQNLYRFSAADINADNYEEQFLLYVDNELDEASKEKVEVFVLQHPAYQDAFTLLKQTKLPLEQIVLADKSGLYRKEEKKPVVYLYWRRIAIAAALIGLIILTGKLLPDHATQTLASTTITNSATPKNDVAAIPNQSNQTAQQNFKGNALQEGNTGNADVKNQGSASETGSANTVQNNLLASNNNPVLSSSDNKTEVPTNTLPVTTAVTEGKSESTETVMANNNNTIFNSDISKPVNTNTAEENNAVNSLAHTTAYKELDTDDEKKSLYLGSLEINKDKLRGLFRKASAIFRSKAKQEEDNNKAETSPRNLK